MKVSVIIPTYNEEERVSNRIESLVKCFDRTLIDYELLIIADGCTDKTPDVVLKYANGDPKIRLLCFPERLGKGGAVIEGLKVSKGNVKVITDADSSVSPKELLKLIKEAETQEIVIGSRYAKNSKLPVREPFLRYLLGRSFNALTKLMFWSLRGINDTQCGAKAIKGYVIDNIMEDLFITGFAFDVNLICSAMRKGFKIKEVGITWSHVEHGSKVSKALIKLATGMFFALVKLRIYYSRFKPLLQTSTMRNLSSFLWRLTKA